MHNAVLEKSKQLYSVFLKLYPKNFREEFGEEMHYVFSENLKEAYTNNGQSGVIYIWTGTIVDIIKSLIRQHLENYKRKDSMKTKNTHLLNNNVFRIFAGTAGILMIPLIGMQFSEQWNWGLSDFIIIGSLLIGMGLLYEFLKKFVKTKEQKIILGVILIGAIVWIWAELAVGIFTNWGS